MTGADGAALGALFREVDEAHRAGDAARARAAYLAAAGLASDDPPPVMVPPAPPPGVPLVKWRTPRRIDLVALEAGARRVAKFEDLSPGEARRVQAWAAARGFRSVVAGPYHKRFELAVAAESAAGQLYSAIVSHGDEAEQVAAAEQDRSPEGTRRAGLALGYPPCCVERFASLPRDGLALRDGVNEAAIRAIAGVREGLPWETNPLYQASPVGFSACRADCPEALAFARRLLGALVKADPAAGEVVRATLSRPVLFLRHSLAFVLDGESPAPGRVRYRRAVMADAGDAWRAGLGAWHHHEIGRALEAGDETTLDDGMLRVLSGGRERRRWRVVDPDVPMLLRFT
jgi:hypothetical protein